MGEHKFNKTEIESFKKKEKLYRSLKNPLILLKDPKDLADLLNQMVVQKRNTYYKTNGHPRTQKSGKQRSIEDMYRVLISYYPKISYQNFFTIIDDLRHGSYNSKNQFVNPEFLSHYCTTVRKEVHNPSGLRVNEGSIRSALGKRNIKF
jgi:hypothetical protein